MTAARPGDADPAPTTSASKQPRSARSFLAAVFWLLASISVLGATLAPWAHQSLLTSGGWGNIVGGVIERPEVQEAVATVGVERLSQALDVKDRVAQALPGPAFVADALTGAVERRITDAVAGFIGSEGFRDAFVTANEKAHDVAMRIIRDDDNEAITAQGGLVTLNLLPLIEVGLQRLQDAGIIDASRQLPDLSGGLSADAAAALSKVLGRDIPTDIGTIVLVESDRAGTIGPAIRWFDLITGLSLLLWALFTALAVWLSGRRARMIAWLSAGAIVALIAARFLAQALLEAAMRKHPELEAKVVISAIIEVAVDSLMGFTLALMFIALVVGAVAIYLDWHESRTTSEA